jgi:putative endonuclease
MEKVYHVYIVASRSRILYVGVTNDLLRRVLQHRKGQAPGFTSRYNIHRLVHYEAFCDIRNAIAREKEIKDWTRAKKVALIESKNPTWEDLAERYFSRDAASENTKKKQIPRSARNDNGGALQTKGRLQPS